MRTPILRRALTLRVAVGRAVVGAPWKWLTLWLIAWTTAEILFSHTHMYSWHYVMTGARVLRSPDWFALYGLHPELQMGPLTFVVAEPLSLLPKEVGRVVAAAVMAAVGLLIVREVRALVPPTSALDKRRWLLISAILLVGWLEVAVRFGHLDDVMALLCGLIALRCVRTDRLGWAALLIGLSIDFKPWAVPFAAVLLIPSGRRRRILAISVAVAVVAAAWLPFLVLDPTTIRVTRFVIHVDAASSLHLLGIAGSSTPSWSRPAQVLIGAILAVIVVRMGRWTAVILVVIAVRLLLDPATQPYYDSGLLIGAAILDFATTSGRHSWRSALATTTVVLFIYLPSYLLTDLPELRGILRTAGLLTLLGLAFYLRPASAARATPPTHRRRPSARRGPPVRPATDGDVS